MISGITLIKLVNGLGLSEFNENKNSSGIKEIDSDEIAQKIINAFSNNMNKLLLKVSNIHHVSEYKHLLQNRKNIQDASAIYVISSVAGEQNPRPKTVVFFSLIFSCFKAEILRAHKLFYSDRLMGSLFFGLIVFVCDLWFRWHVEKGAA